MDRWADEHYQVHYLPASLSYAIANEDLEETKPNVDKK